MVWTSTGCADCDRLTAGKCWKHQGLYDPPPLPSVPYFPAPIITRTMVETCNHCWCERSVYKPDHARCCKCHDDMHDQFLSVRSSSTESEKPDPILTVEG